MSYMMTYFVRFLVKCNLSSFFLKSFGLFLISSIRAEAATDYAAVSLCIIMTTI